MLREGLHCYLVECLISCQLLWLLVWPPPCTVSLRPQDVPNQSHTLVRILSLEVLGHVLLNPLLRGQPPACNLSGILHGPAVMFVLQELSSGITPKCIPMKAVS